MYKTVHHTKKFDTERESEMQEYSAIRDNPLCSILQETREKLEEKSFMDGKLADVNQHLILVVVWSEKILS